MKSSRDVAIQPGSQEDLERLSKRAERCLLIGSMACGSLISGIIGVAILWYGITLTKRLEKANYPIRPWPVTIMGVFCLIDAGVNMFGWALAVIAHDASFGGTFYYFYGRDIDNAYYYGWNGHPIVGGVGLVGETIIEYAAVFLLFPMRIAGALGFLRMKRWGLQVMITTGWMYAFLWVEYTLNMTLQPDRFATTYGVIGWWVINLVYMTPFVMLPWLYLVNRNLWSDDDVDVATAHAGR